MEFGEEDGLVLRFLDGGGSERMGAGIVCVSVDEERKNLSDREVGQVWQSSRAPLR
jgi:hypothetical protein